MDDLPTRRVTFLDGPNVTRIEGKVSFIEDGKRREIVVEATDGSAAFIPARLIISIDEKPEPEPRRQAVEWPTYRPRGVRHTTPIPAWDDTVQGF